MKERRSEEVAVQSTELGQTLEEQGITVRTERLGYVSSYYGRTGRNEKKGGVGHEVALSKLTPTTEQSRYFIDDVTDAATHAASMAVPSKFEGKARILIASKIEKAQPKKKE
tara:strand:- start:35 stop:370 length:336 start_codon:yes stop_codon:yes gene_type:complete